MVKESVAQAEIGVRGRDAVLAAYQLCMAEGMSGAPGETDGRAGIGYPQILQGSGIRHREVEGDGSVITRQGVAGADRIAHAPIIARGEHDRTIWSSLPGDRGVHRQADAVGVFDDGARLPSRIGAEQANISGDVVSRIYLPRNIGQIRVLGHIVDDGAAL